MNSEEIICKWDADLYDQEETQTEDIEFMLPIIGTARQDILEACCGSGRILVPLTKAGHHVTGFDGNEFMLAKIEEKSKGIQNLQWYHGDAITDEWGRDFDVVVLAGNILINIITEMNYKEAQELFIQKAYDSLKPGGHIYLDFNLIAHPELLFGKSKDRIIFEGTDCDGNYGTITIVEEDFNNSTQICTSIYRTELKTKEGQLITQNYTKTKHIPTLENVETWLKETGFNISNEYGDYQGNRISESTCRAIMWAEKRRMNYEIC